MKQINKTRGKFKIIMLAKKQEVRNNIQSNLSDSKLSGQPKENRIIQEFELGKLCIKYIIVKGPIKTSNYSRIRIRKVM